MPSNKMDIRLLGRIVLQIEGDHTILSLRLISPHFSRGTRALRSGYPYDAAASAGGQRADGCSSPRRNVARLARYQRALPIVEHLPVRGPTLGGTSQ
eukprot:6192392-Pleurochrysis_carterae.AAC.1